MLAPRNVVNSAKIQWRARKSELSFALEIGLARNFSCRLSRVDRRRRDLVTARPTIQFGRRNAGRLGARRAGDGFRCHDRPLVDRHRHRAPDVVEIRFESEPHARSNPRRSVAGGGCASRRSGPDLGRRRALVMAQGRCFRELCVGDFGVGTGRIRDAPSISRHAGFLFISSDVSSAPRIAARCRTSRIS